MEHKKCMKPPTSFNFQTKPDVKKKKRHLRSAFRSEFLHRQFLLAKPAVKAAVPASENSSLAKK
jgi:hypothetical protein